MLGANSLDRYGGRRGGGGRTYGGGRKGGGGRTGGGGQVYEKTNGMDDRGLREDM